MEGIVAKRIIAVVILSLLLGVGFSPSAAHTLSTDKPSRQWVSAADNVTENLPPMLPEKGHPKLGSQLSQLVAAEARKEAKDFAQQRGLALTAGNEVRVVVEGEPVSANANRDAVAGLGGRVETGYQGLIQAVVPIAKLTALADNPNVRQVRLPMEPLPLAVSEGVSLINASGTSGWQSANFTGAGVKIAILDAGFQGYTARQSEGELPASLTAQSFRADGDITGDGQVHGTACAEIVYDIAPSAQFYLVNSGTDVEFYNAVDWLIAQNVDIVSYSMGWPVGGPNDGTGPINDKVKNARDAGILWVSAAGNSAQRHWQGPFVDNYPDNYHEFNASPLDQNNSIYVTAGNIITVLLKWDDPWGFSANDYDLLLYDNASPPNLVAWSDDTQDGNDDPVEGFRVFVPQGYSGYVHIVIFKYNATRNVNFHLYSSSHNLEYQVPSGSISIPADSPYGMAAGAVFWNNPTTLESFSSRGPTESGLIKPDLVAPDGVTTVSYTSNPPYGPFYGTSASTPHTAGAAALIKGAFPAYSPAQLQAFLEGRAASLGDLGDPGKDNLYGSGRLYLGTPPAMYGDANGDNRLDATDITALERILMGLDDQTPKADANQDTMINARDITKIERLLVGLDGP